MKSSLLAVNTPHSKLVYTGLVYTNPEEQLILRCGSKYVFCERIGGPQQFVFSCGMSPDIQKGYLGLSSLQRKNLNASLNQPVTFVPWKPTENDVLATVNFTVRFLKENRVERSYKSSDLEEILRRNLANLCLTETQEFVIDVAGTTLVLTVIGVQNTQISQAARNSKPVRGLLIDSTNIVLAKASESSIKILGSVNATSTGSVLFGPNFNFEQMGIGGLDKEFADIFRRAFASRVFPSEVVANLGIHHVKGILLYGPPGTGKTLIARKIGQMLNAREPKIVNGPSILNKFVGQSEENIRLLFAEAEQEQREKGLESELHIIIFDELDAICKERGSHSAGGTGVGDSVVNQLLSKLDGVEQLNNILVIGMTNRKDLIDEALLRPGRLEVHMEIGLPDEHGRVQIFNIHTTPMRKNNYLDLTVSMEELAMQTKNFSGAEIEGVVKSAASFAMNRQLDAKSLDKPDPSKIKVRMEDFTRALGEVRPAFGVTEDKLEKAIKNGIIPYSQEFVDVLNAGKLLIRQVESSTKTPLLSVVLSGMWQAQAILSHTGRPGSGKSALAAHLALASKFPFIKVLAPEDYIGYVEASRADKIHRAFKDAYKSELSVIVIDDLERFIDYAPIGPRFSNVALQALIILLKTPPPKGKKLFVIGTTSQADILDRLGLLSSVDSTLEVPSVSTGLMACNVIRNLQIPCTKDDFNRINSSWQGEMEVKKLITLVEMVAQAVDPMSGETFGDKFVAMKNAGILRGTESSGGLGRRAAPGSPSPNFQGYQ